MVRASARPDGVTAPVVSGFSIQERMKRTSSSRRMPLFCSKRPMRLSLLFFLRVELLLELLFVSFELKFDLSFERALALLEQLNVLLDRSFERALSQFEKALLFFKLLLEQL